MPSKKTKKLLESQQNLENAIEVFSSKTIDQKLSFLLVVKAFEVLVEYSWKELKRKVEDEGLDAPSPKEAIRQAARLSLITKAEDWIDAINARNSSVHDYFSIPEEDYVKLARTFLELSKEMGE